jgi:PII-like signaling protein
MQREQNAKILRVHCSESDRYGDKSLYEAVVAKCREMQIAGASVFRGLEGYGETGEMHTAHLVRRDQPIVIIIVDTAENVARLVPVVEEMMHTGLIASSDVRCIRVEKDKLPADKSGV